MSTAYPAASSTPTRPTPSGRRSASSVGRERSPSSGYLAVELHPHGVAAELLPELGDRPVAAGGRGLRPALPDHLRPRAEAVVAPGVAVLGRLGLRVRP